MQVATESIEVQTDLYVVRDKPTRDFNKNGGDYKIQFSAPKNNNSGETTALTINNELEILGDIERKYIRDGNAEMNLGVA